MPNLVSEVNIAVTNNPTNITVSTVGVAGASQDLSQYLRSGESQDLFLTTGEGDLRYLQTGASGDFYRSSNPAQFIRSGDVNNISGELSNRLTNSGQTLFNLIGGLSGELQNTGTNLNNLIGTQRNKATLTGLSITGGPSISGLINFTGIGGLLVLQQGNTIQFSGGAAAATAAQVSGYVTGSGISLYLAKFAPDGSGLILSNIIDSGNKLQFGISDLDSGYTGVFYLSPNAQTIFQSKVGILSATPKSELEVSGNVNITQNITGKVGNFTSGIIVNGGALADNNGRVLQGIKFTSDAKCGLYISDNFAIGSSINNKVYLSVANSTNNIGNSVALFNQSGPTGSQFDITNFDGRGANTTFNITPGNGNTTVANCVSVISQVSKTVTGTSYGFISSNFLQSNSYIRNFIGYYSKGRFNTSGPLIDNQYDFYADDFLLPTNGNITNRFGLYIGFTNTNVTGAYGIYQKNTGIQNYFGGYVGIRTSGAISALDVSGIINSSGLTVVNNVASIGNLNLISNNSTTGIVLSGNSITISNEKILTGIQAGTNITVQNNNNGSFTINSTAAGGTTFTGGKTLDFGSISAGSSLDLSIDIASVVSGDLVTLGIPFPAANSFANMIYFGWVSGDGIVNIRALNNNLASAMDPQPGYFKVKVERI